MADADCREEKKDHVTCGGYAQDGGAVRGGVTAGEGAARWRERRRRQGAMTKESRQECLRYWRRRARNVRVAWRGEIRFLPRRNRRVNRRRNVRRGERRWERRRERRLEWR